MGALTDLNDRIADVQAQDHVRLVTRRSGSSFFWAIRRLSYERRNAMYAVYTFCREVDDIADEQAPTATKLDRLQAYRREVDRIYDDGAETKTGQALQRIVDTYDLDKRDMDAVIDGMTTDAATNVRMADMDELRLYMDRVACSVGRLSNRVFGIMEPECVALAKSLGEALQLTNILRDLDEDAARGRMYIPIDMLRGGGIHTDDPVAVLASPMLENICKELANHAVEQFTVARKILANVEPKRGRPAIMMLEAYWLVLRKLQERGWQAPRGVVSPTMIERLGILVRHGIW